VLRIFACAGPKGRLDKPNGSKKDETMKTTGPFLSVAETCRRLGISRKALRLYETQGLVNPGRTLSEWRVYGPEQIARLHQVLALKRFGFPLNRVAEILNDKVSILNWPPFSAPHVS
jgi:hypothetical protein